MAKPPRQVKAKPAVAPTIVETPADPTPPPAPEPPVVDEAALPAEQATDAAPPLEAAAREAPAAEDPASEPEEPVAEQWVQLTTGMSGVDFSLSPGDKHPFRDVPGPDGEPSEAERIVAAGFGTFCSPPED
ncbi:MAG TPA: hypothetical protein VJM09_02200 [Sphingobium sp.]|nr:hypothetical protein [Sphingobium sp.]